jgi:Holliday junction DNA helicase RuvA
MIARLTGTVDSVGADHVIVDVGGVGYLATCSKRTLMQLGGAGSPVRLFTEMRARDELPHLYGFLDAGERDWFRLLTTVQGVGARVALAILSVLPPDKLTLAIAAQDRAAITAADGVGPKLATRLLSELKDKTGTLGVTFETAASVAMLPGIAGDAVSALVNLGYGRSEVVSVVAKLQADETDLGTLIRKALKELGA